VNVNLSGSYADPGLVDHRALALLAGKVRAEAVTMAFSDVFYLMTLLFVGALIFVPLLQRPAPVSAAAKEAAH